MLRSRYRISWLALALAFSFVALTAAGIVAWQRDLISFDDVARIVADGRDESQQGESANAEDGRQAVGADDSSLDETDETSALTSQVAEIEVPSAQWVEPSPPVASVVVETHALPAVPGALIAPAALQPALPRLDAPASSAPREPESAAIALPPNPLRGSELASPVNSAPIEAPAPLIESAIAGPMPQPLPAPTDEPRMAYVPGPANNDIKNRLEGLQPAPMPESFSRPVPPPLAPMPRVEPTPEPANVSRTSVWQSPESLLREIEALKNQSQVKTWARDVLRTIDELSSAMGADAQRAAALLDNLDKLNAETGALAGKLEDRAAARRLRQAGYALTRRTEIWRQLLQIDAAEAAPARLGQRRQERLALCLADIDSLVGDAGEGRAWRDYLMLDALREQVRSSRNDVSRDLAAEVLKRMGRPQLTAEQRQFLASRPVTALERSMRGAVAEPIDLDAVLKHVEQYEKTRMSSDGQRLAADCEALMLSPYSAHQQLARRLEMHYRNANLRVAVSEKLINRMVPQSAPESAPVYETVQGVPVVGQSLMTTAVAIRMMPDPNRARLALEVNGQVSSQTSATSGPATFYTLGNTVYNARKPMEISPEGVRVEPAQVNVYTNSRLQDWETDLDGVPLLGALASRIALQQHEQQKPAVDREVKWKVGRKARQRIDAEANARADQMSTNLQDKVIKPLNSLSLEPKMIAAETTDERVAMRVRLAGFDQVGAHTARPQAPADSLLSLQVHESAINNALQHLELDGRTFALPELRKHLASRLQREDFFETDPDNDDVTITFAERDAMNVRFEDGQLVIALSIKKLAKASRVWKDFQVRAFYKPQVKGRSAELVRDGIVHLIGTKLNTGAQIALRSVFSKAFSRNATWNLTPDSLAKKAELSDLAVTQLTIDDGWLGLAYGPKRVAAKQGLLRR